MLSAWRWVVLTVFSLVNLSIQLLWITYAPVSSKAAAFYGVSDTAIGALAMSFMVAFLPMSIPASWVIDTRGFKFGVGVGAALMAVFGPLRGLVGNSYALAMGCTVMLAISQPFFLNAWTKCAALWFPQKERATAVGVITLANLVGTGVDVAFDPLTYAKFHGSDTWMVVRFGIGILDTRTSQLDAVETIERSSIDFYATSRNLYRQSRDAKINDGKANQDNLPNL